MIIHCGHDVLFFRYPTLEFSSSSVAFNVNTIGSFECIYKSRSIFNIDEFHVGLQSLISVTIILK